MLATSENARMNCDQGMRQVRRRLHLEPEGATAKWLCSRCLAEPRDAEGRATPAYEKACLVAMEHHVKKREIWPIFAAEEQGAVWIKGLKGGSGKAILDMELLYRDEESRRPEQGCGEYLLSVLKAEGSVPYHRF